MEPREPISNSIVLPEINEETPDEELIAIIDQEPHIYFDEGGFRRDHREWFSKWDYDAFRLVLKSPEEDSNEELYIIFNEKARVYDRDGNGYKNKKGLLLVINQNYYRDTLVYSQGLDENTVYLENYENPLTQEEGTDRINSKLQKIYFGLFKAKAYALLRNSLRQKSIIGNNRFDFEGDRSNEIYTRSIDMILEITKNLLSKGLERRDIINKSDIKYKD